MSVAIVIPTWNNIECLVRCLESILDYTRFCEYRILVVDNGSTDPTPHYLKNLRKEDSRVQWIGNAENLGFIKGTNQGLAEVKPGENALLLNDDTQVTDPLWLEALENDLDGEVGAVGPTSNTVMGIQVATESYRMPMRHEVNFLIGFCMLIRSDALAKVGFLDESFGANMNEDLDYSIRLVDAGYKLMVDRSVFIAHYGSQTILRTVKDQQEFAVREATGRQRLYDKWGNVRVNRLFEPLPEKERKPQLEAVP